MQNGLLQEPIACKIEKLLHAGISLAEMARRSGLKQASFYKWKTGMQPGGKVYDRLRIFLDNEWLVLLNKSEHNGRYHPTKEFLIIPGEKSGAGMYNKHRFALIPLSRDSKAVLPELSNDALAAGTIIHDNKEPKLVAEFIDAPFLGPVAGVVEVKGEHMRPTLKNGTCIIISYLNNADILNWGECYFMVDKNWQCMVRRIYPGKVKTSITLESDNPDKKKYPPVTRRLKEIEAIFKVNAAFIKY